MKIAILTQPLGHNYGGILQAYALQSYLKKIGNDVVTINRKKPEIPNISNKTKATNFVKFCIGKFRGININKDGKCVFSNLYNFIDKNIEITELFENDNELIEHFKKNTYDLVVVGSDQVWRPKYSPSIGTFFGDFCEKLNYNPKIISYSASFGVDNWEYTKDQTNKYKELIKKFDAVSVRESSAITLCNKYFNVDAEQNVDPTLLLDKNMYEKLITIKTNRFKNKVLSYILDPQESKQLIGNTISEMLNKELIHLMPQKKSLISRIYDVNPEQYPQVEEWIQAFRDSSFVVTDSFHGCVFSIIFNKPFIAVGNLERGLSRFQSLFTMFNLNERLVSSLSEITKERITKEIDWVEVNKIKQSLSNEGKDYLNKYGESNT